MLSATESRLELGNLIEIAEQVFDAIDVPIFIIDVEDEATFRFRALNRCHEQKTGLTNELVRGKTPQDFAPARTAATLERNYGECVRRRAGYTYEECLDLTSGPIWWQTTLTPTFADGRIVAIVGVAFDITERKNTEFQLAEASANLKRLNDELSVLTSTAAHDLRGPLRQIKLIIEMIKEDFRDLGDQKADLLNTCDDITAKALSQIDELLSYSRSLSLTDGAHSSADFWHMCSDLTALLDPLSRHEIAFPDLGVETETVVLQIILRNLLDNAVKHAKRKIDIDIRDHPDSEGWLLLTVSDDGKGFTAEGQSAPSGVNGFGLAAVGRLIDLRGGDMKLERSKLGGASVICRLPGKIRAKN